MREIFVRNIILVVVISLFGNGAAADLARDAQEMLGQLGYKISVDGKWGPQSKRVISSFYSDRDQIYDGVLSENEIIDLTSAIQATPYKHPRAKLVNYTPTYEFPSKAWPHVNWDQYRAKFLKTYGRKSIMHDGISNVLSPACKKHYFKFDTYRNKNLGTSDVKYFDETADLTNCLWDLTDAAHQDVIENGNNGAVLNYFFADLVPAWVENEAFSAKGMRSEFENVSAGYTFVINRIAFVYTRYAEYWGTSKALDEKFRRWWDNISKYDAARIYQRGYERCREFSGPKVNPSIWRDECANVGTDYASALIHMGLYYKDDDYINEGIFVAGASAKASSPEGFVVDGIRGARAVGYMLMTAQKLDEIALMLDDIDVNFYEMSFAKHGVTVRKIIEVTAREMIKPNRVFDYACPNEGWYKESCYHQNTYAFNVGENDWSYSINLRTIAGAIWDNPDYMPFIQLINPNRHTNGYTHAEGAFNRFLQLKYFPPKNRYYENDPTPEDRNQYRDNLGSSAYIRTIVKELESLLN